MCASSWYTVYFIRFRFEGNHGIAKIEYSPIRAGWLNVLLRITSRPQKYRLIHLHKFNVPAQNSSCLSKKCLFHKVSAVQYWRFWTQYITSFSDNTKQIFVRHITLRGRAKYAKESIFSVLFSLLIYKSHFQIKRKRVKYPFLNLALISNKYKSKSLKFQNSYKSCINMSFILESTIL